MIIIDSKKPVMIIIDSVIGRVFAAKYGRAKQTIDKAEKSQQ